MGCSSTLFSGGFLTINGTGQDSLVTDAITSLLGAIGKDENDVALVPNPFANWEDQPNPVCRAR
jgi:lysophospholipase